MNRAKRNTVLILVIMMCFAFAKAQTAQTLLKDVNAKINSYENIGIDFKYALTNEAEGVEQITKGSVIMEGDKYALKLMGTTQLFDGTNVYTIVPEDEEVTISAISDQDEDAITPSRMLSFFNEGYTQKMDITQNVKGRTIQYVKLIPIDSNSDVAHSLLGVDKQTKHIYRLIITQKNGTAITITVNNFKTDQPLAKNIFAFDESKYKDYYINRL